MEKILNAKQLSKVRQIESTRGWYKLSIDKRSWTNFKDANFCFYYKIDDRFSIEVYIGWIDSREIESFYLIDKNSDRVGFYLGYIFSYPNARGYTDWEYGLSPSDMIEIAQKSINAIYYKEYLSTKEENLESIFDSFLDLGMRYYPLYQEEEKNEWNMRFIVGLCKYKRTLKEYYDGISSDIGYPSSFGNDSLQAFIILEGSVNVNELKSLGNTAKTRIERYASLKCEFDAFKSNEWETNKNVIIFHFPYEYNKDLL